MKTYYKNVNILDGTKDMVLQENMMITVENGRITAIEESKETNDGKVVNLQGKYMIPGLINMHVHTPGNGFPKKKPTPYKKAVKIVMSNPATRAYAKQICKNAVQTELLSGTTTIRTVGGLGTIDNEIRDDINEGKYDGPRIISCGQAATVPEGHMEGSVAVGLTSNAEFINFVSSNVLKGAEWTKLMITGGVLDAKFKGGPGEMKMTEEQIRVSCEASHNMGIKVAAHVESPEGVKAALKYGVDTIEHGSSVDEECIELFKKNNSSLICTLSPAIPLAKFDSQAKIYNDVVIYNSNYLLDHCISGIKTCLENDIPVGLGTDTVCPFITHYDMWRELEYYHLLIGVSRQFALHSATLINAQILGIDNEVGSIEVGKYADFVIVNENPLNGFNTLRKPYMVHFKDKQFDQPVVKKSEQAELELDAYMGSISN